MTAVAAAAALIVLASPVVERFQGVARSRDGAVAPAITWSPWLR